MNKSVYTRPNKPRTMATTKRREVPTREPLSVPVPIAVHASTECFVTPAEIVELMVDHADIEDGQTLLEPSAGTGAIANYLRTEFPNSPLDVFEVDHSLRKYLKSNGYELSGSDFLESGEPGQYDRILMNPPFKKLADIDHVRKAYSLLKRGGRLVAIMGAGAFFNSQNKGKDFREWIEELGAEYYDLPEDSFKNSGTGVNAKIIILDKEGNLWT